MNQPDSGVRLVMMAVYGVNTLSSHAAELTVN